MANLETLIICPYFILPQREAKIEISNLITKKLKKLNKNQNWLAKELGVSKQAISMYVKQEYLPRAEIMDKIYELLSPEKNRKDYLQCKWDINDIYKSNFESKIFFDY